jgi:hypothetical protein
LLGPVCWTLLVLANPGPPSPESSSRSDDIIGWFIAFVAIPRDVAGPILLGIEATALFLFRTAAARGLLLLAMAMDVLPLLLVLGRVVLGIGS